MSRKKPAPHLMRGGNRFSEKDMRKPNKRERCGRMSGAAATGPLRPPQRLAQSFSDSLAGSISTRRTVKVDAPTRNDRLQHRARPTAECQGCRPGGRLIFFLMIRRPPRASLHHDLHLVAGIDPVAGA